MSRCILPFLTFIVLNTIASAEKIFLPETMTMEWLPSEVVGFPVEDICCSSDSTLIFRTSSRLMEFGARTLTTCEFPDSLSIFSYTSSSDYGFGWFSTGNAIYSIDQNAGTYNELLRFDKPRLQLCSSPRGLYFYAEGDSTLHILPFETPGKYISYPLPQPISTVLSTDDADYASAGNKLYIIEQDRIIPALNLPGVVISMAAKDDMLFFSTADAIWMAQLYAPSVKLSDFPAKKLLMYRRSLLILIPSGQVAIISPRIKI